MTSPRSLTSLSESIEKKRISSCEYYTRKALDLFWKLNSNRTSEKKKERFSDAIFLQHDLHFGQASVVCQGDGTGLSKVIIKNAGKKLAQAEEKKDMTAKGRCVWYFGPEKSTSVSQFVMLVTDPKDIAKILQVNTGNNHDSVGNFERILGKNSIFEMEFGSEKYKNEKKRYKELLFDEDALTRDIPVMQECTREFFKMVIEDKKPISVQKLAKSFTMEIISRTKLGVKKIDEAVKSEISAKITAGAVELGNLTHNFTTSTFPFLNYFPFKYFLDKSLKKIVAEGNKIIADKIIQPNKDTILKPDNWITLNKSAAEIKAIDLNSEEVINRFKQLFIVGHDTTANIFEFCLKFLAEHPQIYLAVREEIDSKEGDPLSWTSPKDYQLPLLSAVILETLRLAPSIGIMVNKMSVPCKLREDDKEEDKLQKGDIVFFSQYLTHRAKHLWSEDADKFNPYRFLENGKIKSFSPYQFFPFGFNPRMCLGQNMAKFEIAMALTHIIKNFDLQLNRDPEHDPYDIDVVFTLKSNDKSATLEFLPRKEKQHQFKKS